MAFHPFQRVGRAVRKFAETLIPSSRPKPTPRPSPIFSGPAPARNVPSVDTDYTDDEVIDHIVDLVGSRPEFKMRTVTKNVHNMDPFDRWLVMRMDVEEFRQFAATNPIFWYH